jgi:hypothetical protein
MRAENAMRCLRGIVDLTNQLNRFAKQVKDDRQKLEALARLEK